MKTYISIDYFILYYNMLLRYRLKANCWSLNSDVAFAIKNFLILGESLKRAVWKLNEWLSGACLCFYYVIVILIRLWYNIQFYFLSMRLKYTKITYTCITIRTVFLKPLCFIQIKFEYKIRQIFAIIFRFILINKVIFKLSFCIQYFSWKS